LQQIPLAGSDPSLARTAAKPTSRLFGRIPKRFDLSQPTISHHMKILTRAGLVEGTKVGQWMWYRRNEKALRDALHALTEEV